MTKSWMDNHPRRLVHYQQNVVFVDDVERNILRENQLGRFGRDAHHNLVAHLYAVTGLAKPPVDRDLTGLD